MADQIGGASGNATAAQLLSGYTASVASGPITGTMPNNGSPTWTPTKNPINIAAGYYSGGTINGSPRYANGNGTVPTPSTTTLSVTVTGLAFTPSRVVLFNTSGGTTFVFDSAVSTTSLNSNGGSISATYSTQSGGFTLTSPLQSGGDNYNWVALE